ncbi:MAG: pyridoxal phosphate-dependent aminotransferase [Bradymonadaceae bacterium]
MSEAARHGYDPDSARWTNFGQGQPQTDILPGAPERISNISIHPDDHEYAPVSGIWELREAVADHYNRMYRRGMGSQYSAENVSICGGGRTALTRLAAALGTINLGHFLPDYTAYEELLDLFRLFNPIPILLDPARGYEFTAGELRHEILGRGLSAILLSNPCNPTGKLIGGETLSEWIDVGRKMDTTLLLDEFYSHYIWDGDVKDATAANFVEDVERDPVVIVNGLTKSWRYPGWRMSWTLGPRDVIDRLMSAGSFLDGGAPRPLQRAAIELLDIDDTHKEIDAIQQTFSKKRRLLLDRLLAMGITVDLAPQGTFYIWGNVSKLPEGLSNGMDFFRAGLNHGLICVPGEFFDVNPGQRRASRNSRFINHVRFSFGPAEESLRAGLDRMEAMIRKHR